MAQGSIIWRCPIHNPTNRKAIPACDCSKAQYYTYYRNKWRKAGRRKKDAEVQLAQISTGYLRVQKPGTLAEYTSRWLADLALHVKPATVDYYKFFLDRSILPAFGHYDLTAITADDIQKLISSTYHRKKWGTTSVNGLRITLGKILKSARKSGYVTSNVVQDTEAVRSDWKEPEFLNPAEVTALLEASPGMYCVLFSLAILTGMRQGELLGWQWSDINWKGSVTLVKRSLYRPRKVVPGSDGYQFLVPKTKSGIRSVKLSPEALRILEGWQELSIENLHNLLFCTSTGSPLHADNVRHRQFKPALERAKLKDVPFHALRHTCATLLLSRGANIKFVQQQLGHASIQTTLDLYGHLLPDVGEDAVKVLDQTVFGTAGARTVLEKAAATGVNGGEGETTESS